MKNHRMLTTLGENLLFPMNTIFFHPSSHSDVHMSNNRIFFSNTVSKTMYNFLSTLRNTLQLLNKLIPQYHIKDRGN